MSNPLLNYITTHRQDAVIYKAGALLEVAGDDPFDRAEAIDQIQTMLACIANDALLEYYIKEIAKSAGLKGATLAKGIRSEQEELKKKSDEQHVGEGQSAVPKWVSKDRLHTIGFDWRIDKGNPENTGMYFPGQGGHMTQLTSFFMKPIVHIISDNEQEQRRITEVSDGVHTHVFEFPSTAFLSPDKFEQLILAVGFHHCKDGFARPHLNKIKAYMLKQYPKGYEITTLGWQAEGFFAFSNVVWHNGIKPFDEYGLADINDVKFLSMGASNILVDLRPGTDIYKNDKHLRFEPAPLSFKAWTKLMLAVYEEKAMMGVAWCLLAINRDIVSARTNYCPIPYCYGAAQSGKSQFVASLVCVFTKGLKPFNLNQGTEYAFWEYLGRFKNVLSAFNEFDVQSVEEKRVRAFKGVADCEGRNKGSGRRNKSETQEVNSLPILLGQYLATMDDNSLLGRTTPLKFTEVNDRQEEQIREFEKLKKYEEIGFSGLLADMLEHRNFIADNYLEMYSEVSRELKADFARDGHTPKNRVVENYTVLLTLMKLYSQDGRLEFAWDYEAFYRYCRHMVMNLNTMVTESNVLGDFWKMLESLSDKNEIEPGWDYKIETMTEVKSMLAEKSSKTALTFDKPTRLLFLRLNSTYPVFAKEKRNVSGKPAITEATIKSYLVDQPYYVGAHGAGNFKSRRNGMTKNTSSMVINYDVLCSLTDVNLVERDEEPEVKREGIDLEGHIREDARIRNDYGTEKLSFAVMQDQTYVNDKGFRVENYVNTYCKWNKTDMVSELRLGAVVRVTGYLAISTKGDRQYRNMEVTALEMIKPAPVDPDELQGRNAVRQRSSLFSQGKMGIEDGPVERDEEF